MDMRFRHRYYSVRPNLLGSKLTVADRNGTMLLFVPIKNLGHSSEVKAFPDKKAKEPLLVVRPVYPERGKGWLNKVRHFLSGPTHHDVTDPETGETIGALRLENSTRNPKDQEWVFMDAADRDLCRVEPVSSSTWGAKFEHSGLIGDRRICRIKSGNSIAGRYVDIDLEPDTGREIDTRLAVAVAVKMAVDMVNLNSA